MEFHPMRDCDAWRCKLYDAALTQYVKWYDSPTYGGLENTLQTMLNHDQNFILGHCLKNGLELIGASGSSSTQYFQTDLNKFNSVVEKIHGHLTQRERDHVAAIQCLFKGNPDKACDLWEAILIDSPTDLMALKFAHDCYFYMGQATQMRDSVARVLPSWHAATPLYSELYGIYSFGLVQSNNFHQAKTAASKALEMNLNDAWATHTLCHFFEYSTEYDSGIQFLNRTEKDWSVCNMLSCHNYWHLALYHIEKAEYETALEIYKNHIAENLSLGRTLDMVDMISLLFRLKLDGYKPSLDSEWNEIAQVYKSREDDHGYIFNDAHIAMMLSSTTGYAAKDQFIASLNNFLTFEPENVSFLKDLNSRLAARIFEAIFAYNNEDFDRVVDLLYPIKYELVRIGGSNAQRDLFQQLLIQSALRSTISSNNKIGMALLNERRALKVNSSLTERIVSRFTTRDSILG